MSDIFCAMGTFSYQNRSYCTVLTPVFDECQPFMIVCLSLSQFPVVKLLFRGDVKIPTYKPHTNHKRSSVRSHSLAPTTIWEHIWEKGPIGN